MSLIETEIDRRGGRRTDYFDEWITRMYPSLYEDRYPEEPAFISLDSGSTKSGGWGGVYWNNWFTDDASDLNDDGDYEFDEPVLDEDLTPITIIDVNETSDRAEFRLEDVDDGESIAAAMTDSNEDIVPDEDFDTDSYERYKWTAVADFYPEELPDDEYEGSSVHSGAFIRAHNRPLLNPPNPTHFGTTNWDLDEAFGGVCAANDDKGCGALQFQGDDGSGGDAQALLWFEVDPEMDLSSKYRLQILEREYWHALNLSWDLQWKSEIWDFDSPANLLGERGWIWEWTVENIYGVEIPDLTDSAYIVSYCCQDGDEGDIDVDMVGTVAWVY